MQDICFFNHSRDEKPRFPSDGGSRRFGGGGGGGGGRDTLYPQRGPGGPGGNTMGAGLMSPSATPQHSSVLMAYNLPMNKINCDKIFNLLCLYGNVSKVSTAVHSKMFLFTFFPFYFLLTNIFHAPRLNFLRLRKVVPW